MFTNLRFNWKQSRTSSYGAWRKQGERVLSYSFGPVLIDESSGSLCLLALKKIDVWKAHCRAGALKSARSLSSKIVGSQPNHAECTRHMKLQANNSETIPTRYSVSRFTCICNRLQNVHNCNLETGYWAIARRHNKHSIQTDGSLLESKSEARASKYFFFFFFRSLGMKTDTKW